MENISSKEVYFILANDEKILQRYEEINKREEETRDWAVHNFSHIENVMANMDKILIGLNFDEHTIYCSKIAGLLHDVGALEGKDGHAERSYLYAKELFENNNWNFKDSDKVLDAIRNHSGSFDSDNIITLSIILADKLDVKKTRIPEEGRKVVGNRQYAHINDIDIKIDNNILTINFITDGNIDIKEVNEYYFTTKIFKAIKSFANKMNLDYEILMDNKEWNLDNKIKTR